MAIDNPWPQHATSVESWTCWFCGRVHTPDLDPNSCPVLDADATSKAWVNCLSALARKAPTRDTPSVERDRFPPDADLWQFSLDT